MSNLKILTSTLFAGAVAIGGLAATSTVFADNEDPSFTITSNGKTITLDTYASNKEETADEILGNAINFGVVSNEWTFNGESETNVATKKFVHEGGGSMGQTGLTDKCAGSEYGYTVIGDMDNPVMLKGVSETVSTTDKNKDKFVNSTNGGSVKVVTTSEDNIEKYIDGMIGHVSSESLRLSKEDSVKDYSKIPSNQLTLDVTSYGTKTAYLHIDKSEGLLNKMKESSGVTIKKNPEQIVVINSDAKEIYLNKIEVEQNGRKYGGDSLANQSTRDNAIAKDLVFNFPNAIHVELHNITGIVLAPQATLETYDVTGGWIITNKFINHCEHHFTNGSLSEKIELPGEKRESTPTTAPETSPQPTTTSTPTKKPEPTTEPTIPEPTVEPSKSPEPTTKPIPKRSVLRIHAIVKKDGNIKPEENLKIAVTKTSHEIPETEQNSSDKSSDNQTYNMKIGDEKDIFTDNKGDSTIDLEHGTYSVEAKREDAPVVEKEDKTVVYVHNDTEITGENVAQKTFNVEKEIDTPQPTEETKTVEPAEKPSEEYEETATPEVTIQPSELPVPVNETATSESAVPDTNYSVTTNPDFKGKQTKIEKQVSSNNKTVGNTAKVASPNTSDESKLIGYGIGLITGLVVITGIILLKRKH